VVGDGDSESDGSVLNVDPAAVHAFVAQAIDGPSAAQPPTSPPITTTITVDVFNASASKGLAKAVSDQLTGQGPLLPGTVGNAPTRATSVVRYATGAQDAARTVADTLGGLAAEEDPQLATGTVRVYLGKDYGGPAKRRIALRRTDTPVASDIARPIAETSDISSAAVSTPTPPAPAPPGPSMVGGTVPCID
ncbi:MAG: LytR C-terminal domain-containing protein, partial [Pseudonocardiaceae bacterium]